jgi:hypothetical protein
MHISQVLVGIALAAGVGSSIGTLLADPNAGQEAQIRAARTAARSLMPGMTRQDAEIKLKAYNFEKIESGGQIDKYQYRSTYLDLLNVGRQPVTLVIRSDRDGFLTNFSIRE